MLAPSKAREPPAAARLVGDKMSASLGQPVIVENKPGAASNISIRLLLGSPPDGHTVMLVANGLTANPFLYTQQPFDPTRDVTPVPLIARRPVVIAANASSDLSTIADVLGGQLPLVAVNAVEVLPHVKAGKLRVLAALSAERVSTPTTPQKLAALVRTEYERYGRLIRDANVMAN
ncbi:MAG: hypothetical protein KF755_02855 [Burkholderiaceae bacterium]|nr:hypothetical protein [Burkholderiaceae bacterium]